MSLPLRLVCEQYCVHHQFPLSLSSLLSIPSAIYPLCKLRLRFSFDETNFALVKADSSSIGENVVVGGENSWKYSSFVNWDFLPSEEFPILVYFKETQTPKELWVDAPIVVDQIPGQAHFFPAIADTQELKKNFIKYGCKKAGSAPVSLQAPSKMTL